MILEKAKTLLNVVDAENKDFGNVGDDDDEFDGNKSTNGCHPVSLCHRRDVTNCHRTRLEFRCIEDNSRS